jgi:hypothetical protein
MLAAECGRRRACGLGGRMNNVQYFASYCAVAVASGAAVFMLMRQPEAPLERVSLAGAVVADDLPSENSGAAPACDGQTLETVRLKIADYVQEALARGEPRTPELEMQAALSVCSLDEIEAIGRDAREDAERQLRR